MLEVLPTRFRWDLSGASYDVLVIKSWTIDGADGQLIRGDASLPQAAPRPRPRGVIFIAHGFKGYKDYGMFPRIASECAAAGFIAHRFNFSHSGMTNNLATFERPDLFEQDTFNKQVFDLRAVIDATSQGEIEGQGLPYVLFGHSRGGVTALLTAGRYADDPSFLQLAAASRLRRPAGIITAAAPSSCNPFSREEASLLLSEGFVVSASSRTSQQLRIGRAFLQEQLDDPPNHDLLSLVKRIRCPIIIIHGETDPTVPMRCADEIAQAAGKRAKVKVISSADHVFNTPNPMPADAAPSPQLRTLMNEVVAFAAQRMKG